ncbi:MAG: winged helix-turn-helix transcriptional regulator [Candidatus Thorarchaeota archaeon]
MEVSDTARVEYSLTEDGVGLRTLITPLMTWASNRSS